MRGGSDEDKSHLFERPCDDGSTDSNSCLSLSRLKNGPTLLGCMYTCEECGGYCRRLGLNAVL